jgi:dihydrofolate reductase
MSRQGGRHGHLDRYHESHAAFWPVQPDNPYTRALNATRKYVVTSTLPEPLPWRNSAVVKIGDVPAIKRNRDLVVLGSGELVRGLLGVVDEFKLLIYPLVLGGGRRLFGDEAVDLRLRDA